MKILVLAPSYPYEGHSFAGTFNEKSAVALSKLCETVQVLIPRPYAPAVVSSLLPRWKGYSQIPSYEIRSGLPVYRPAYLQIPKLGGSFWTDPGAFLFVKRIANRMHRRARFDAIISFDLVGAGGLAWRLSRELGIPASGWATGNDMRVTWSSSHGRVLLRAVQHLDMIFYQSEELLEIAANMLGVSVPEMNSDRHVVLPRGIGDPPVVTAKDARKRVRGDLRIEADQVLVLYVGRILQKKGVFELLEAVRLAAIQDRRVICAMVGSNTAFDDTKAVQKLLKKSPELKERILIVPACEPNRVWDYLWAADIFAFPSHSEGMPNSLLEAMVVGLAAIAFAIPPILEIEAGTGGLVTVPPLSAALFSEAILRLTKSPTERFLIGQKGKQQVEARFMVRKNMAEVISRLGQVVERRKHFSQSIHKTRPRNISQCFRGKLDVQCGKLRN